MTTNVTDNKDQSRFEIHVDGTLAGFAVYHLYRDLQAFTHTEIGRDFGGQGLASELIRHALDEARARGHRVEPFCPFVRGFIVKNPDYRDLVPAEELDRFELAG